MKRSEAKRAILKVLRTWEGSKLEMKTADEVLTKLEEIGMMPPVAWIGSKGYQIATHEWEPETKPKRRKK